MRLFEAIMDANHRAIAGDAKTFPKIRYQLVTNRHQLNTGCCRVSQPVTICYRLKAVGSELVTNCYQLKTAASEQVKLTI